MTAAEMIRNARARLTLDAPFFASVALRLGLKEDPTCPTGWTDGKVVAYNPAWVEKLSIPKVQGFLAHEVMHVAMLHHIRRQGRDSKRWNVACDAAINGVLERAGFQLPENGIPGEDGSAEAIYGRLPEQPEGQGQSGQGDGQGSDGQGSGDPGSTGSDPGGCGEVRDYPAPDGGPAGPADLAQGEAEAKVLITQAAQAARMSGSLPAEIDRLVTDLLRPRHDVADILRRFVAQAARDDYSWSRPNRRLIHTGLVLPGVFSEELGPVILALDTSGSVSQADLEVFAELVSGVLEQYDTTATVVYCDTTVGRTETFSQGDLPIKLRPVGGGGTDYRPVFKWVEENGDGEVAALVYLTDGYCDRFPSLAPPYDVLWVISSGGNTEFRPPFGEVVRLEG